MSVCENTDAELCEREGKIDMISVGKRFCMFNQGCFMGEGGGTNYLV